MLRSPDFCRSRRRGRGGTSRDCRGRPRRMPRSMISFDQTPPSHRLSLRDYNRRYHNVTQGHFRFCRGCRLQHGGSFHPPLPPLGMAGATAGDIATGHTAGGTAAWDTAAGDITAGDTAAGDTAAGAFATPIWRRALGSPVAKGGRFFAPRQTGRLRRSAEHLGGIRSAGVPGGAASKTSGVRGARRTAAADQ